MKYIFIDTNIYIYCALITKGNYTTQTIDALNKNCSPDEFERLQALNDRLQLLYYSYLATSNVDSQRRVNIPDQIIRSHGFTDSVIMQGCGTNLTIYSDKETYEDYVRKLRATK